MIQGMETEQRVELLLSLTSVRSESQISALKRHFVDGLNASACAAFEGIPESNFQRVIDRVQKIDAKVEQIKDLDWGGSNQKSDKYLIIIEVTMSAESFIRKNIFDYLIQGGCSEPIANKAADKGVEFFKRGNHKDPYFDSLCHAGICVAEALDPKYKFKKPQAATSKSFRNTKPKSRKHKQQPNLLSLG